jgi:predicted porin
VNRKKSVLNISIALLAWMCTQQASAQSSVTMFGIVDVNVRSVTNGGQSIKQLATNGMSPSQIGFRGAEDLGGGLQAGFWIEGALFADTGTADATKLWGRRTTVSLAGNFGEIRLGRDQAPSYRNLSTFDPFSNVGVGSRLSLISTLGSGANTLVRIDNTVAYFLPPTLTKNCNLPYRECGLYGHFAVSAGEGVPGVKYRGGRLGYAVGPVNVAIGYGVTGTATADDYKVANIGAAYDFNVFNLIALYNESKWGVRKQRSLGLSVTAPVGPFLLRASVQRANASGGGTDADDAKQWVVGSIYYLSKRTALYGTFGHISNDGAAAFAVSTPPAAALASGRVSKGYEFGLRHAF